jgi:lipid II:glycine glycyltransferase (peptidoglycan interpeptide bridge formation enzyme)
MTSKPTADAYDLEIGADGPDEAWDAFVDRVPGGHHVQTTRWAAVKTVVGWEAARVVVRRDGEIAGGCQLLIRRLPALGAVAYGAKAPLASSSDPNIVRTLLAGIDRLAKDRGILYVKLQPPCRPAEEALASARRGLVASDLPAAPVCSVRIRTDQPLAEIFRGFHRGVRSNIRKSERRDVGVRTAGDADVPAFVALVGQTARRQGFPPYPEDYYRAMWSAFARDGRARLLLAEHGSMPLAGILVVGFGDNVTFKIGGWAGVQPGIHPNELLHWTAIRWAHENGYRFYDFDGIDERVGRALAAGEEPPADARHGVTRFKLSFGGDVALFPGAYDYGCRPWLRPALRVASPRLRMAVGLAQHLLGRRPGGAAR